MNPAWPHVQVTLGPSPGPGQECVPYNEQPPAGASYCDWKCYATLVLLNGTATTAPRAGPCPVLPC